jgi:cell wall-associated NlpC family hydrolase
MPATDHYVPRHRAVKHSAIRNWKRVAAVGTALPAAFATAATLGAPAAQAASQQNIDHALEVARDQKGDPYEYGGDGPDSFDCSGLVQYSYEKADIEMPRTSEDQAARARTIAKEDMEKGDLMFFDDGSGVYHVGIFGGWNGEQRRRVLHASEEGEPVKTDLVWTNDWYAGTMRG